MRYLQNRARSVRFLLVSAALGTIVLAGAAVIAIAAYPQDTVTVYTGCLNTGGTSAGNIGSVAVGSNPAKSCGQNQLMIHLSGGTITKVSAGTGLTGGGADGYVGVAIDPHYQLPQTSCSSGQFVASDGSGGWSCTSQKTYGGSDFALSGQSCNSGQFLTGIDASGMKQCANNQTYNNGAGLDLTGNTFSVNSGFRLPQNCNSGQTAVSNGNNTWGCHSTVGGLSDYIKWWNVELGDNDTETATVYCDNSDIATGGGVRSDSDVHSSSPTNSGEGWFATASTGFDFGFGSGYVTAYVKCLHMG
jgi:hypothetical protein